MGQMDALVFPLGVNYAAMMNGVESSLGAFLQLFWFFRIDLMFHMRNY